MSNLFVWKEKLQKLYAEHSVYVDKALQFILAFAAFWLISSKTGYMKPLAQPVVTMVLAVICTFLPVVFTIITAAALIIAHMFSLSLGIAAVTAAVFLVMFIFYFRFAGGTALIALLMPLAFACKVPYVIPVVWGLIGSPVCIIPVACGTIVYFMIVYINASATVIKGSSDGIVQQITVFIQKIFQNKEMWLAIAAFALCLLFVYTIRKLSVDHSWEIAIVCGSITNLVVMVAGDIMLDIHTEYVEVIAGSVAAALIAFIVHFFVFTVDYSRTERLQFEDDEYYYYVKAVPKIQVTPPEKMVKRINERQDTAPIDTAAEKPQSNPGPAAAVRKSRPAGERPRTAAGAGEKRPVKKKAPAAARPKQPAARPEHVPANAKPEAKPAVSDETIILPKADAASKAADDSFKTSTLSMSKTEELLLAKSLQEELDIQNIVEEELKK